MQDLTKTVKDAAYVVVGLGLIGVQKAQVRRVELTKQFDQQLKALDLPIDEARTTIVQVVKTLEDRFEPVITQIEGRIDDFETMLPETAKDLVQQARGLAKEAQAQVRDRIAPAAPKPTTKSAATATKSKSAKPTSTKAKAKAKSAA